MISNTVVVHFLCTPFRSLPEAALLYWTRRFDSAHEWLFLSEKLMEMARDQGKKPRPDIKLGICGEHGGEPESVKLLSSPGTRLRRLQHVSSADCTPGGLPTSFLVGFHTFKQAWTFAIAESDAEVRGRA
jgi:hypothetical protein